jgi:hypothetical protein
MTNTPRGENITRGDFDDVKNTISLDKHSQVMMHGANNSVESLEEENCETVDQFNFMSSSNTTALIKGDGS